MSVGPTAFSCSVCIPKIVLYFFYKEKLYNAIGIGHLMMPCGIDGNGSVN